MSKHVHEGCTIECLSAEVISRKILPSAFINIRTFGKCFTYKCSLNSEAQIIKELTPKEAIYNEYSHLNIGEKLECDKLLVVINVNKPYTPKVINLTGRHKAQTFITQEYTLAKISSQLHNIPKIVPPVDFKEITGK